MGLTAIIFFRADPSASLVDEDMFFLSFLYRILFALPVARLSFLHQKGCAGEFGQGRVGV